MVPLTLHSSEISDRRLSSYHLSSKGSKIFRRKSLSNKQGGRLFEDREDMNAFAGGKALDAGVLQGEWSPPLLDDDRHEPGPLTMKNIYMIYCTFI